MIILPFPSRKEIKLLTHEQRVALKNRTCPVCFKNTLSFYQEWNFDGSKGNQRVMKYRCSTCNKVYNSADTNIPSKRAILSHFKKSIPEFFNWIDRKLYITHRHLIFDVFGFKKLFSPSYKLFFYQWINEPFITSQYRPTYKERLENKKIYGDIKGKDTRIFFWKPRIYGLPNHHLKPLSDVEEIHKYFNFFYWHVYTGILNPNVRFYTLNDIKTYLSYLLKRLDYSHRDDKS